MSLRVIKVICYLLGLAFLLCGFYLLLLSEELLLSLKGLGISVEGETAFWKALAFAYMITISALSFVVARNVALYWRIILVLALAKFSSSLAGIAFYVHGFDLGGLVFAVDFPLAMLFTALYLWALKVKG